MSKWNWKSTIPTVKMNIPDDSTLAGATVNGSNVAVYDDFGDNVYVYGQYGPKLVIRAQSWEDAYNIAIDECTTIEPEDVPEAYGFDGWDSAGIKTEETYSPETAKERFEAAMEAADETGEYPELLEGYTYQSNVTGTGIVAVGHHEWLRDVDEMTDVELVWEEYY
jgi:hypothetical protein